MEFGTDEDKNTMLLTGDVEDEGEELLLKQLQKEEITDITILKVAHHGSKNSTTEKFLKQIKPKVAIISCGKDNHYGHPHKETMERLEKVGSRIFNTMEYGQITIIVGTKQQSLKVEVYK